MFYTRRYFCERIYENEAADPIQIHHQHVAALTEDFLMFFVFQNMIVSTILMLSGEQAQQRW